MSETVSSKLYQWISPRQAALWVLIHTIATVLAALMLGIVSSFGWIYILPVALASARLLWHNLQLLNTPTPGNARALFMASNIYLMILLLASCIDALLPI
jgi:heme O synthase-like polyprenyltransferase